MPASPHDRYPVHAEAEALLEMAVADMVALLGGGQAGRQLAAIKLIRRARILQRGDRPEAARQHA